MIYRYSEDYRATKITCGELVKRLADSGGYVGELGDTTFIEREGESPSDCRVFDNWAWIQAQHPTRKLILLEKLSERGKLLD